MLELLWQMLERWNSRIDGGGATSTNGQQAAVRENLHQSSA